MKKFLPVLGVILFLVVLFGGPLAAKQYRSAAGIVRGDTAQDCDCVATATMTLSPTFVPSITATPTPPALPTATVTVTPVLITCADIEKMGANCLWENPTTLLITLGDIAYFDTAKDTLKPQGYRTMKELVGVILAFPEQRLYVHGHTDIRGSREMNQSLSERRAFRVRNTLAGYGLPKAVFFEVKGFAFDKAVGDNNTVEGRARNRRTEIRLKFTRYRWDENQARLIPVTSGHVAPEKLENQELKNRFDKGTIDDGAVDPTSHGLPTRDSPESVSPSVR